MPLKSSIVVCLLTLVCSSAATRSVSTKQPRYTAVVLYEGATLIDGDTGLARPNAAFIVEGERIGRVGANGEISAPRDAARVDLSGKAVMPALVSAHMHIGLLDGNDFGPQVYTHEKIVEHL